MAGSPAGFNKAAVTAGLRTAMNFGAPNRAADRATFCWVVSSSTEPADDSGVPFSPEARPTRTLRKETVPCAIDYTENIRPVRTRFGNDRPDRIEVTLLDPDFQKVKDFEYVVWGGDKYVRRSHQINALGSLDIHTIQCNAEDEA